MLVPINRTKSMLVATPIIICGKATTGGYCVACACKITSFSSARVGFLSSPNEEFYHVDMHAFFVHVGR